MTFRFYFPIHLSMQRNLLVMGHQGWNNSGFVPLRKILQILLTLLSSHFQQMLYSQLLKALKADQGQMKLKVSDLKFVVEL